MKKHYIFILLFVSHLILGQTPTGNSTEVGITEGQLSVSLSGAATYNIPIAVPPGINGVVPQVSLAYNSQGGNGMAGYGWNISGVSAITRIPRTKFHDGVVGGVNLDANDRFALDGQRLILKTGTVYGAAGTTYETENFSNVKITAVGVSPLGANYGPASFLIEYPDGSKAEYGATTDSRSITTWGITYWENPQGVRISYSYLLANNNLSIEYIKYGSTGTNTPINQIQFVYVARQRPEQSYVAGQSVLMNTILKEIKTIGNGVGFRNYVLELEQTSLGYERFKSITEKSGDGTKSYNPTVFTYAENSSTIGITSLTPLYLQTNLSEWFSESSLPKIINGDFDGDGDLDFIANSMMYTKVLDDGSNPVKFDFSSSSNFSAYLNRNYSTVRCLEEDSGGYKLMTRDALCTVQFPQVADKNILQFNIYSKDLINNSVKFEYSKKMDINDAANYLDNTYDGDFNGDGLTDKIVIKGFGNYAEGEIYTPQNANLYFVNLDRRIKSNYVKDLGILQNVTLGKKGKFIKTADVNGDGKTDLIFFNGGTINSISVFSLDNDDNLIKLWETPIPFVHKSYENKDQILFEHVNGIGYHNEGFDSAGNFGYFDVPPMDYEYIPIIGDFNGDGKSDIILTGFERLTLFSTGFSFEKESLPNNFPASHDTARLLGNDFNNDGKTDVLVLKHNHTQNLQPMNEVVLTISHLTWMSKSNWATNENSFPNLNANFFRYGINPVMIKPSKSFKDKPEILLYEAEPSFGAKDSQGNDVTLIKAYKIGFFVKQDALTNSIKSIKSITTGSGVKETITYSSLMNGNGVYTASGQIESYPNIDIANASGFQVVSKIEKQSSSVYKKQLFAYYGAVSSMEGLGFLGFRSTVRTNWYNESNAIISSISKFDIDQRGANIENYTVLGWHDPLTSTGKYKPKSILKRGTYTITGSENLVATQSIILKPNSWIQAGSTFTAKIDPNANVSPDTLTDYITKSIITYESELLPNKVFKTKNVFSKQHNKLEDTNSETTTIYDIYNNPKEITTLLKEGASVVQTTETTLGYDDQPNGTTYYIGRPTSKTQSVTVSGDTTTSDEVYRYTNNLLSQVKKYGNGTTDFITEDNVYDSFGNITKKTITVPAVAPNPAPAPRVTNYEYNPVSPYNGRFLTKSEDVQRLTTQFDYNPSSGVLNSVTNPYNLTTSYLYDSWFKKKTTTDYLGKKNTYNYIRSGSINIVATAGDDGSNGVEVYDDLGRKTQTTVMDINGNNSNIVYAYDIYDRKVKVFEPNNISQWSETKYDEYGRVKENISYTGKTVTMSYLPGSLVSTVNDGAKTKTFVKNAMGNVVSLKDETPTTTVTINYTYFANGNLKTTDYGGIITEIEQDEWGRKKTLKDPTAGTYRYTYNGFGETTSEITPNGTTTYNLDDYGRLDTKTISGNLTNSKTKYNYDATSKLLISSIFEDLQAGTTTNYTYEYDASKRMYKTVETTPSYPTFTKQLSFDSFGRVEKETSISGINGKSSTKTIKNTYKNGFPWQIIDDTNQQVLWQTNTVNARGQLLTAKMGNGIDITNTYDNFGYVTQFKHDKTGTSPINIMTLNTTFDALKGNLKTRNENNLFGWSEDFTSSYDDQDRLTSYKKNIQGDIEYQSYDGRGKITRNTGLGDYNYNFPEKYRNSSVRLTPEAKAYYEGKPAPFQQNISYNVFKSPYEIIEEGVDKISFTYNDNNDRSAMFYGSLDVDKNLRPNSKFYSADGTMEIKITPAGTEFVTYIGGDAYTAPILIKSNGTTQNYLYLHRDYLGSILAITDANAAVLEKRLFDAWGSLISVQNGAGVVLTGLTVLDRGYTGHEHLQSVALINMNGRIYDPKLHRFLQPDNNIQDPFNTQNYNRYSYVLNNPLKYNDPSGESAAGIFGWLFAFWVNGSYASGGELNPAKWNSNGWINAGLTAASPVASIVATNYVNGYMEKYSNPPQVGVSATNGVNNNGINSSSNHPFVIDWSKLGTRVVGGLQMVGGVLETIGGSAFGTAFIETGVGGYLGYAVAINGADNASTGFMQLWTGESQNTLLHKGVRATYVYAGASYDTAESAATHADISAMAFGGYASYKSLNSGIWKVSKAAEEGSQLLKFGGDEAILHFEKHGKSVMEALGKNSYNLKNYVNDANFIVKNGTYVPELNGYIRFIGGQGSAKFGFVGLNRFTGNITTFHIKTAKELAKKVPTMFGY